jgi:hypothetical protein
MACGALVKARATGRQPDLAQQRARYLRAEEIGSDTIQLPTAGGPHEFDVSTCARRQPAVERDAHRCPLRVDPHVLHTQAGGPRLTRVRRLNLQTTRERSVNLSNKPMSNASLAP